MTQALPIRFQEHLQVNYQNLGEREKKQKEKKKSRINFLLRKLR